MPEGLCSQLTEVEVSGQWGRGTVRRKANGLVAAADIAAAVVPRGLTHGWNGIPHDTFDSSEQLYRVRCHRQTGRRDIPAI